MTPTTPEFTKTLPSGSDQQNDPQKITSLDSKLPASNKCCSSPPTATATSSSTPIQQSSYAYEDPIPNSKRHFFSLNDFIKNNYAAFMEQKQQQQNDNDSSTKNEKSSLLGNSSGWHYNHSINSNETASVNTDDSSIIGSILAGSNPNNADGNDTKIGSWTIRKLALELSLWFNVIITITKCLAYFQTLSLSVLAALLDSLLDVVSQLVLNYTEKHSSMQRSSALYPAGASRLEPIGVLTCASLMGMASFEVLKESFETLYKKDSSLVDMGLEDGIHSALSMAAIVVLKLLLLWLCNTASNQRVSSKSSVTINNNASSGLQVVNPNTKSLQLLDPTLEAVAQDHWNDALSNGVSAIALLLALYKNSLWWCDSVGAILISIYIIHSWYHTGKEQIEHLTGKSAPSELMEELMHLAEHFDERLLVDTCRAYHFGPKFLVELEVVMPMDTLLKESHDLGMELQYEIEAREEVERCFVHIDYESRDYDEHVVSKVPELREHLLRHRSNRIVGNSAMSV